MNEFKKKWLLPVMFALVLSFGLVGCANNSDKTQTGDPNTEKNIDDSAKDVKDTADNSAKDVEDNVRDMNYEDIKVTPEEAFDKFMELHADAKVTQFDLDKELMEYQYVIEGYDDKNEYEVKINPVDGKVISDDLDVVDLNDENGEITKAHLAKVDNIIDKAKKEDGSNSELDEWDISVEDGKIVMDVEIGVTEYSYDMDTEELIK